MPKTFLLKNFCADKEGNSTYKDLCSCYYPEDFYDKIINKISSEFTIPEEYLDPRPQCIYSSCKYSSIVPDMSNCQKVNLAQCFQNIDLAIQSKTSDNINISQDAACKSFRHL